MDDVRNSLKLASVRGDFEAAKELLVSHDLSVDIYLCEGVFSDVTILTTAAEHGQIECVRDILQYGDVLYRIGSFNGVRFVKSVPDFLNAIIMAAAGDHVECVVEIAYFRMCPIDSHNNAYKQLVVAAKEGQFQLLDSLLAKMLDKSYVLKGWKGHNIMNLCLFRGCNSHWLQKLIDHGVSVNGWDYNGLTPLMCAIIGKNMACVHYLIQQGADVRAVELRMCNHFDDDGTVSGQYDIFVKHNRTVLMIATCIGDIQILETLLKSVSLEDVNRQEAWDGEYPLAFAIKMGNKEVVSLLLQNGAEITKQDFSDRDPLSIAVIYGQTELFHFFMRKLPSVYSIFLAAEECIYVKNVELLDILIKSCNGAIFQDTYEGKLLGTAISENNLMCVQYLIDTGHCGSASDLGKTALIPSCRNGGDAIVEYLIRHGVELNAKDDDGITAVRYAAKRRHTNCLQLLLGAGVDVDMVDNSGQTVFCDVFSTLCEGEMVLEILLKSGKLCENGKLKSVHRLGVKSLGNNFVFTLKSIVLLMQYNLFQWDWCVQTERLSDIAFAAVTEGYSPGKWIGHNGEYITLMRLAMVKKNADVLLYLLMNLYFLPSDLEYIKGDRLKYIGDECNSNASLLEENFTQPLRLQTWSFLVISGAISRHGENFNERTKRVNSLPLPTELQLKLKFHTVFSRLCPSNWEIIGEYTKKDKIICNLLMDKKSLWKIPFEECSPDCCNCLGSGTVFSERLTNY